MVARAPRFALAALAAALLMVAAPASAQEPIFATIAGPRAASVGQAASYNLSINGGPIGSVNYTVEWYLTGPNPAGGAPLEANPTSSTGTTTSFRLNITAPTTEQTILLVAKVSALSGGIYENTTAEQSIVVVTPIALGATFRNEGSTAALNVTVRFYVDDASVGSKTIARIDPNGLATTSFDYLPVGLQPGTHRIRIEADLDGNGIIDPSRGEAVASELFYKGTTGLSTGWTVLIGIAIFLPVLFVTVGLRRRRRT